MRSRLVRLVVLVSSAGLCYVGAVILLALGSHERVLGFHQPGRLCGASPHCHRTVEVAEVRRVGRLGTVAPEGQFWIVTLRYRSDATGKQTAVGPLAARVRSAAGRWYDRNQAAEAQLADSGLHAGLPRIGLDPDGSFVTRIIFDLPPGVRPRLHVRDDRFLARLGAFLLPGGENTFLHARTWFALDPGAPTATIGEFSVSLISVETDTTAGSPWPVPADGLFWTVTLDVEGATPFDARLVDRSGRQWERARDVEQLIGGDGRLVFDVSDAAEAPVLEIRASGGSVRIPLT